MQIVLMDQDGLTALVMAVVKKHAAVVTLLLDRGADIGNATQVEQ